MRLVEPSMKCGELKNVIEGQRLLCWTESV